MEYSIYSKLVFFVVLVAIFCIYVIVIQRRTITKQRHTIDKLTELTNTDALTGLLSRRAAQNGVNRLVGLLRKVEDRRHHAALDYLSVLFMDIDHFKKVNDTYGHDVGDDVLRKVSAVIKATLRDTDLAGRWGGEEFIVALPNTPIGKAKEMAEKVRKAVSGLTFDVAGLQTSVSIGVVCTEQWKKAEDLIKLADDALYSAKDNGRDQVCVA